MKMAMRSVPIGKRFSIDGERYVRIPDMRLDGWEWGFVVNCIAEVTPKDEYVPPTMLAKYISDESIVLVDTVRKASDA